MVIDTPSKPGLASSIEGRWGCVQLFQSRRHARAIIERFRPAEGLISTGLCDETEPIDSAPIRLHGVSSGTRRRREEE